MKKKYETPIIEVFLLDTKDIITTSTFNRSFGNDSADKFTFWNW